MKTGVEISFHGMDSSPAVEAKVHERLERLEHHFGRLISFRAVIDAPHRSQHQGKHFDIKLEARGPAATFLINREPGDDRRHEDVYVALHDAFDALERKIRAWSKTHAGRPEVHMAPLQGRIVELRPDKDFGQIALTDGRLVYFHRNSVIDADFDMLSVNSTVTLSLDEAVDEDEKGPHATSVRPISPQDFVDQPQ